MKGEIRYLHSDLKQRHGFSLTEILVVIALLAILASILSPSLRRVSEQARQLICTKNLKQLGAAFLMYVEDYDGYLPASRAYTPDPTKTTTGGWIYRIRPYYDETGFLQGLPYSMPLHCPSNSEGYINNQYYNAAGGRVPGSIAPYYISYMINLILFPGADVPAKIPSTYLKLDSITSPSLASVLTEGLSALEVNAKWVSRFRYRHNGMMNVLFSDFHIGNVKIGEIVSAQVGYSPYDPNAKFYPFWDGDPF